ncbi:TMEM175 family protein [Pseudoduganella sp. LjRoot289]|uniref:TMEM175 family protein n=1 Tax=Pseudoduganella sp. LjRoot289 TaxID=3342314 RepID=UPI003ED05467
MGKGRLEAFSDGVIAIIITIMVLELKVPHGATWDALLPLASVLLSYVLSFVYVGIYWNNHHHMMHTVSKVSGGVLWANLHLLFWLSLIPFVTGWMGENRFAALPAAIYGVVLAMSSLAYVWLEHVLIKLHGPNSPLARAVGKDHKVWVSLGVYVLGIAAAALHPLLSVGLYVLVAVWWFIPDRRIEAALAK